MWHQEATELSAHFARVESVFAEGDLRRITATLSSIRQGLALVGDVPEFRGGAARLQVDTPGPQDLENQMHTCHRKRGANGRFWQPLMHHSDCMGWHFCLATDILRI
jgi:hypothetical protein